MTGDRANFSQTLWTSSEAETSGTSGQADAPAKEEPAAATEAAASAEEPKAAE